MVARSLFILIFLQNTIFDNFKCAAPLTSATWGGCPVAPPITTPLILAPEKGKYLD